MSACERSAPEPNSEERHDYCAFCGHPEADHGIAFVMEPHPEPVPRWWMKHPPTNHLMDEDGVMWEIVERWPSKVKRKWGADEDAEFFHLRPASSPGGAS